MFPRLLINTNKITENARWIVEAAKPFGVNITGVNKGSCECPAVAKAMLAGGVGAIGDSRMENFKKISDLNCEKWLIRIPMLSELEDVVRYATLSCQSETGTIRATEKICAEQNQTHDVIVMTDLGDLREGCFETEDLLNCVAAVITSPHLNFKGIGVNLSCAGAIVPTLETYEKFTQMQVAIQDRFGIDCEITSGGASSTFFMVKDGTIPNCINNLRVGEMILLGTDISNNIAYDELHHDTFVLQAEIVEIKTKPSHPIGKIGRDSKGRELVFPDKGIRKRALCALGHQDTPSEELFPTDPAISVVTASSDHLILDITDCEQTYAVGDIISFHLNYVSMLNAFTSPYVEKVIL